MTPKELRAAAERYRELSSDVADALQGFMDSSELTTLLFRLAEATAPMQSHILATVRDDDDEPVTVEWYREAGFHNSFVDQSSIVLQGTVIVDVESLDATVCNGKPNLKTRGDVRKLCPALSIELKEPTQ